MTPEVKERIEQIRHGIVPEGYKRTKVGIAPNEWKEIRFREIFTRLSRKNAENNDNVLTISAQYGLVSQQVFFNKAIASEDKSNYYLLRKGEFAYNKSYSGGYPYGALKRLDLYEAGIVSPLYICFSASAANQCPDFYVQYFEAGKMNGEIHAFAQEGARNHGLLNVAVEDFFNSNLLQPPFPEQERIAAVLFAQDKVIELKESMLIEKQRQKKYLMQQLLSGKKRLPGFDGKWKYTNLGEVSKKQKQKNKKFEYSQVFSNSAQHGIIPQTEQFDKEIANGEHIDGYYIVHGGFFVYNPRISVSAPCGPINRNETGKTGVMSPLYTVFSVESEAVNNDFLAHYFKSSCWYRHMKSVANYGARHDRMNVSDEDFFLMPIPVPCMAEQQAIAAILTTAEREIDLLRQDLEQEKQKKKALMQLLLTGIVRVPL